MPRGFVGRAASRYLGDTSNAHSQALNSTARISSNAPSRTMQARGGTRQRLPFDEQEATSGKFVTGRGDSSNIVADQKEYADITRKISQADDKIGECLYRVAQEIENMCTEDYRL
ncbi:MAG: hypothetical protein FWE34_08200, partial [Defluviitaleaceae bacterium]|nr:hypothetical protein [Defluviitaleaceae bacterium]